MGRQPIESLNPALSRTGVSLPFAGRAESELSPLQQMPKLRELREVIFFKAEYHYLRNLISLTGRNIRQASELSGLSRSRLYTLLKKYQIDHSLYGQCRQQ